MKQVILKSGAKGWQGRLRKQYASYDMFEAYCSFYSIDQRLGFSTPKEAWDANPVVQGGVKPSDYQIVIPKKAKR